MPKYRKKPVEIEAWQWDFNSEQEPSPSWMDDAMINWPDIPSAAFEPDHVDGPRIVIATLEGLMIASPGDWIIRGVQGELYPCKPNIFEATYEQVIEFPAIERDSEVDLEYDPATDWHREYMD